MRSPPDIVLVVSAANLVLACRSCNSARKDKLLPAWSKWALEFLGLEFDARAVRRQALRPLPKLPKKTVKGRAAA